MKLDGAPTMFEHVERIYTQMGKLWRKVSKYRITFINSRTKTGYAGNYMF